MQYTFKGVLVHFGGFKNHIGFYPPVRDAKLRREAARYAGPKGNLRFPLDEPIPYTLISKIVESAGEGEPGEGDGQEGEEAGSLTIWVRLGNCPTAVVAALLRSRLADNQ